MLAVFTREGQAHTERKGWHMADVMNTSATRSILVHGMKDTD